MNSSYSCFKALLLVCLLCICVHGQSTKSIPFAVHDDRLELILKKAVAETIDEFSEIGLKEDEIAVTAVDLTTGANIVAASYRGNVPIYPASVVKMFYLAAIHQWEADGKLKIKGEVERGLADMIVVSSNDATGYILDELTDTSSGGELDENTFRIWAEKRNSVNRYFRTLGYNGINVNQKTFCEDAYGVEQQFRNYRGENRNMLTTDAAARLLAEIATGRAVSPERSREMLRLMHKDWEKPVKNPDEREFISHALSRGMRLWSKEGWTSKTRHDAAYVETPDGKKIVIVVFTENHAKTIGVIPGIARRVLHAISPPR
ncbi:MAG: serine hydrolase [Acidobacteria bacterium]|nr:MAG: serine hydrolase [Acidobacteriota bacterium]REK02220.1 MAG: serine hydrolase [Acidobacteriota bacterium]REK13977.1 MAG: serine hydrolase [Acidobacteriota bacterium]REK41972.1 MAG: serine hydrolase [Acidobacteriota bacterium]